MNPKNTWLWLVVAAGLFAFIFFYERLARELESPPRKVLPGLKAAAVTSIQIQPAGQREIRAERTKGLWQLTKPLAYPARAASVESLLVALERLTPAPYLTGQELKNHPHVDEEFGFESWQASLTVQQGDYQSHLYIGSRTAPGDQVYVKVVGDPGVCVVDAGFLRLLPRTADDWRDLLLVDLRRLTFDTVVVTNGGNILELQRNGTNKLWRMFSPMKARADSAKVEEALQQLQGLRADQFVSDDPKADRESFGLQPAEFSLALAQGTNTVLLLEFGKTNNAGQVYARRQDQPTVVTVSRDAIEPWYASHGVFRDRHLVTLTGPPDSIEIRAPGRDNFALQRLTNDTWRIEPQGFPADTALVNELISNLNGLQVAEFVKDVVTPPDLPGYGLASPVRQFILKNAGTNTAAGPTNAAAIQLDFGVQEGKVFARRTDEDFVYGIKPADFERLNLAGWQVRERRIWNFTENDIASITIHQGGKTRQILRNGTNSWSLAAGSQGVINVFAVEETAHQLGELAAGAWIERGDQGLARYGFAPDGLQISVELKSGKKLDLELGGQAPSGIPCAAVVLDQQPWIFEFPLPLYQFVQMYLTIPASP